MKVYTFGDAEKPAVLLLPGTCCHWESNFGQIIPLLASDFRVLCVSYDGFDETERAEFPTMLEETAKIEDWIRANCGGHIRDSISIKDEKDVKTSSFFTVYNKYFQADN